MGKRKEIDKNAKKNDIVAVLAIKRQNALTKFLKRCWVILAFLIITVAVISCLFRALTPWATEYKAEVEQKLSLAFGQKVTINTMETGWYWFEPVVKLNQISISDGKQTAVKLSNLLIGINLFSSLWHWQIQPGILLIEDLHLGLHQENGNWQIDGIDGQDAHKLTWNSLTYQPLFAWILGQQKIIIKNLSADIFMENGTLIPLKKLNLKIARRSGYYHIKGKGSLAQTTATKFQFLADLTLDPFDINKTKGQVFFSVKHLLPVQWTSFAPLARFQPKDGKGDLQFWADITKGQLKLLQAKIDFHHLAWLDKQNQKNQQIQTLKANLAWKPSNEGWELSADQINLGLNDTVWPENSLKINYFKEHQDYFVFVKDILLAPLLKTSFSLPERLMALETAKPQGHLHDTQLHITPAGVDYILTRFSDLGWKEFNNKPGFENLAGALQWQPQKGQLELAGDQIVINPHKQRSIRLAALQAVFNWHKEDDGFRVNIERFIVNHPNLILSAKGIIDKISEKSSGQLNLKAEFTGKDTQIFLPYLPAKYLKPKFDAWLKNDIKKMSEISGELLVNGPINDFPFDTQPGTFEINSHIKGLSLAFARNWPLVNEIEAYLRINKRNMEADIVHSNLQGIIGHNSKVRIDDIGLDKEVLDFQTQINSKAAKLLSLLNHSPLKTKLSALSMLDMQGMLAVDLKLAAPLYPENDKILALGEINFLNNQIVVHHNLNDFDLTQVNGSMHFDQAGILDSRLKAKLLGFPANIFIKSLHEPVSVTELKVQGKASSELLSKKLNLPIHDLLQGSVFIESTLNLADDPQNYSHLKLQSSLEGLGINLPSPLGKSTETKMPLSVDIDFNSTKALNMLVNYNNQLSSDLSFLNSNGLLQLKTGEINFGALVNKPKERRKGLKISGSLESFDLEQWLAVKEKLPHLENKNSLIEALRQIDINVAQAKIWKQNYKNLNVKATKKTENNWLINLEESKLDAQLEYQTDTNTLTGQFKKLHIKNTTFPDKKATAALSPKDLPNLNVNIASLQIGNFDLGNLSMKTKSTASMWRLEDCRINSPSYQINLKGKWLKNAKQNLTDFQAEMQISDLAASLKRWKMSPKVEAKKGQLEFQGGWQGSIADFKLAKLNGQFKMDFKNGRITNLSPETEEKLGLGKLLSIFSLQTIPRRLKLDFSDLSKGGYSFDKFKGTFDWPRGL